MTFIQVKLNQKNIQNGFIDFVLTEIKHYYLSILDTRKLIVFDDYLQKKFDKRVSTKRVLDLFILSLKGTIFQGNFIITINNNIKLNEIDAKLYDVCRLIDSGNLELSPYPILTDIQRKFNDKDYINTLYNLYISR